ncbi:MAG: porphobilinogen synthase [Candidatus Altiarchaeia archaeon]
MQFPKTRMRRLRSSERIRDLVSEVSLSEKNFIYPIFVKEGISKKEPIARMPGQFRYPLDDLGEVIGRCEDAGISGVLLFGVPKDKDAAGSQAYKRDGVVQGAIKKIKELSDIAVFSDVCLCQYTQHGHCGVLDGMNVDNDRTLELLKKIAVSHARSGADYVAPSAMMDGQVAAIREALDKEGFNDTGIMSYSAKFASSFYSPFREAAGSAPQFGDRKSYQMDYRSPSQALREIELDINEGADIILVKPALPCLDIIQKAKEKYNVPLAAYQVSGEYSLLKSGILDKEALHESLTAIKRAGADIIISYAALELGELI